MNDAICSIDGCGRSDRLVRGWCSMHYQRWERTGDPIGARPNFSSPEDAFAARTEWHGDCLIWTGARVGIGYGLLRVEGCNERAHRYAYRRAYGEIPTGAVVRHKCDTKLCVNAEHLEVGTQKENIGDMITRGRAWWQTAGRDER